MINRQRHNLPNYTCKLLCFGMTDIGLFTDMAFTRNISYTNVLYKCTANIFHHQLNTVHLGVIRHTQYSLLNLYQYNTIYICFKLHGKKNANVLDLGYHSLTFLKPTILYNLIIYPSSLCQSVKIFTPGLALRVNNNTGFIVCYTVT